MLLSDRANSPYKGALYYGHAIQLLPSVRIVHGYPVAFIIDGADSRCNQVGYQQETIDISGYADGSPQTITFHAEVTGANGDVSTVFIDNVQIPPRPSICTPPGGVIFANGFEP